MRRTGLLFVALVHLYGGSSAMPVDETNPLVVRAKALAAQVDWPQASLGGAVGFASGFAAKRVAMATVKAGLILLLVAQLPTTLHHLGHDKPADWIAEREKQVETELKGAMRGLFGGRAAPRDLYGDLGRHADEAILEIRPFVKKHASLSGGFATGFVLGLQS